MKRNVCGAECQRVNNVDHDAKIGAPYKLVAQLDASEGVDGRAWCVERAVVVCCLVG